MFTSSILTILPLTLVSLFFYKLLIERRRFNSLPGPPHHWLLGHIPALVSIVNECPPNLHFLMLFPLLSRKYNLTQLPCYYLDLWPLSSASCVVQSGDMAAQITQTQALPKHPTIYNFVRSFAGDSLGPQLEDGNGSIWKKWRVMFNPGFSQAHLMTLLPMIAEKTEVFANRLEEHAAKKDVFPLEDLTAALTVDIIGKIVVDADFNSQRGRSQLVETLREIPKFAKPPDTTNPLVIFNPLRIWNHTYYTTKADRMIGEMLDKRLASRKNEHSEKQERARLVIDIALEAYEKEDGVESSEDTNTGMDSEFRRLAIQNIRGFLFAGISSELTIYVNKSHDTTSSSLCYAFHLLSTNPATLCDIRAEHDRIFGTDLSKTAHLIESKPALLSPATMPYTMAVINETLRLYPAAGTIRRGQPDCNFVDPETGNIYPTYLEGPFVLNVGGFGIQRLEKNFPDPDVFDPTRFLSREDGGRLEEMPKEAFRPFEKGKRNCIGLELANLEMRIVLALTIRKFNIETAYEKDEPKVMGDRAYPTLKVVAKAVDGLPVRVSVASGTSK